MGLDDEEQECLQKEYLDLQTELNDSEDAQEEEKLEVYWQWYGSSFQLS